MTTAIDAGTDKNTYQVDPTKNTWLDAMAKNSAKSTGGYVSYTAGQKYGGECTVSLAACSGDLDKYFM